VESSCSFITVHLSPKDASPCQSAEASPASKKLSACFLIALNRIMINRYVKLVPGAVSPFAGDKEPEIPLRFDIYIANCFRAVDFRIFLS
jgi:hypothetical protein